MIVYLVAVPTVGAYLLTQIALRRGEPTLVASYIYLQPLLSTLGAMALLGERPTVVTALAAAFIFGGVFLSSRTRSLVATPAVEVETPGQVL